VARGRRRSRGFRFPIQIGDGDLEGGGEGGGVFGGDIGNAGLDPPDLDPGRPKPIGESLTAHPLSDADLFDAARNDRAEFLAAYGHVPPVSESETRVQTFHTQKRKPAIPLGVAESEEAEKLHEWWGGWWERMEEWAAELGQSFNEVLNLASVADPKNARATRARTRKGLAPEARENLTRVLRGFEAKRSRPTRTGRVVLGVDEWAEIGRQLAALNPDTFLAMLDAARKRVLEVRELVETPFTTIKPGPKSKRDR
jgi:hypothetical protein